jgi:hypothetical protein
MLVHSTGGGGGGGVGSVVVVIVTVVVGIVPENTNVSILVDVHSVGVSVCAIATAAKSPVAARAIRAIRRI